MKNFLRLLLFVISAAPTIGQITDPNTSIPEVPMDFPLYNYLTEVPTYGSELIRIGLDTELNGDNGYSRHHYSNDQPWSADGAYFVLKVAKTSTNAEGDNELLLNGSTFLPVKSLRDHCSWLPKDSRWHPALAFKYVRIGIVGSTVQWMDVTTCNVIRTYQLPFTPYKGIGGWNGNPDWAGRYLALLVDSTHVRVLDMWAYPSVVVGPSFTLLATTDFLTMLPMGDGVFVQEEGDKSRVLDMDPATLALSPRVLPTNTCGDPAGQGYIERLGHPDVTYYAGMETAVGQRRNNCGLAGSNGVRMVGLVNGVGRWLIPAGTAQAHHISTQSHANPGLVAISFRMDGDDGSDPNHPAKVYRDEIVTVSLSDHLGDTVLRWIQTHTDHNTGTYPSTYIAEAHPVASPDGSRIAFASVWTRSCSSCGGYGQPKDYILQVPNPFLTGGGGLGDSRMDQ